MRKMALLATMLILLLAGTTQARDKDTLTSLARYYADDTAIYLSARTDEDFAPVLTDLVDRLRLFFPKDVPPITAEALLNMFAQQTAGGTFEATYGTWVGDSAAFGLTLDVDYMMASMNDMPPFFISVAITDRDAAMAFLDEQVSHDESGELIGYSLIEEGGLTIYLADESEDATYAVGDDVLFITPDVELLPREAVENPLAAQADFNETVALLPNEAYNILAYIDSGAVNRFSQDLSTAVLAAENTTNSGMPGMLQQLSNVQGVQAWGFVVLDGDTLTMDLATNITDTTLYDEAGISLTTLPALDTAFTTHIPSNALMVAQSSDFGPTVQMSLENLRRFSAFLDENGGLMSLIAVPREMMQPEEIVAMESFSLNSLIGMLNTGFAGLTGLNLERDVLPVLNGDVVAYLRVLPVEDFEAPILPDFGLMFQTDNAEGATMLVDALVDASAAYGTDFSVEAYGDAGAALNMPLIGESMGTRHPNLDLLFGADNGVFSFGTRPAVEAALSTEDNITSTAAYQAAQAYFLPNSGVLLYIDIAPLGELIDELIASGEIPLTAEVEQARTAISLLESATGTVTSIDPTSTIARFTLTLAETPVVIGGES
ncbi:hypothetical protein G4Y79_05805 [Phototrophicus methaneseepsis]|uniref:DUF3352 domain-containing protein n=1 Tax=Phototrophicus methaneseepsis TaxID=2710758 RepID=A0A7S8IFR8_9CHLR|nr:hypothetical protein [Phototrophicus methaneseepsis]QPC83892.1 hypothetical protein G4Y79_05805 [Phototrophicus methaneseepsis]